jgi:membrane protease YdiL (CAAX protease family)
MSGNTDAPAMKTVDRSPSSNLIERITALVEVLAAFALVHLSYRSFKHFTDLGKAEGTAGLNFSTGSVMILFTVAALLLSKRNFEQYGLTLKGWRSSLNIGLSWGVLFVVVAATVIKFASMFANVHFDPIHPPDIKQAALGTVGELLNAALLLLFLTRERSVIRRLHPVLSLLLLIGLLSIPLLIAVAFDRPLLNVLLTVLWLFFGAGFGEEILFRGYIQSRVDQSFGCPWRFLGLDFGIGLFVSSALFGFIHVLNTVDYFSGRFDFAWLWWFPNFAGGLFFGILRARTKSVLAGGIIHGLTDVLARVPALLA